MEERQEFKIGDHVICQRPRKAAVPGMIKAIEGTNFTPLYFVEADEGKKEIFAIHADLRLATPVDIPSAPQDLPEAPRPDFMEAVEREFATLSSGPWPR